MIGRYASTVSMRFPWVVEGTSEYVDDYPEEYFALFNEIILTGFSYHNKAKAEQMLADYLAAGGTLIADLQGMKGEWWEETPSLYNVQAVPISLQGKVAITSQADVPLLEGVDLDLAPFSYEGGEWRAVGYWGLDETWLSVEMADGAYPILGYKDVEGGRVYFVGLNLFYRALLNDDAHAANLCERILDIGGPSHALTNNVFDADWLERHDKGLAFGYTSEKEVAVLISMSYTPHWHVTLDGQPIPLYPHEYLCLLILPAGSHVVEFIYGSTPIHTVANGVSVATALFIAAVIVRSKRLWR